MVHYLEGKYNVAVTKLSISLIYIELNYYTVYGNSYLLTLSIFIEHSCLLFLRCLARALGVSTFHYPSLRSFEILHSIFCIYWKAALNLTEIIRNFVNLNKLSNIQDKYLDSDFKHYVWVQIPSKKKIFLYW